MGAAHFVGLVRHVSVLPAVASHAEHTFPGHLALAQFALPQVAHALVVESQYLPASHEPAEHSVSAHCAAPDFAAPHVRQFAGALAHVNVPPADFAEEGQYVCTGGSLLAAAHAVQAVALPVHAEHDASHWLHLPESTQ